ncbi:MAG: hypothetical protein LC623_05740 [Halobacteriales archaeon]|nr:hypothetical protein [Halobacteriales archaeon]
MTTTKTIPKRRVKKSPRERLQEANDALERQVVRRLNRSPPASFEDLIEEGLLTEGKANTMRDRLRGRLVVVGERPAKTGRGRPHVLYNVLPK